MASPEEHSTGRTPNERPLARPPETRPGRLESWKEISSFLGRGITTLQRWEREEGLPVYRLQHDKRGSVYAYRDELERWWESRAKGNGKGSDDILDFHFQISRRTLTRIAAGTLLGSAAAATLAIRLSRPAPANLCPHPSDLGKNRITGMVQFKDNIYCIVHRPETGDRWAVYRFLDPTKPDQRSLVYRGQSHVERLVPSASALFTVLFDPGRATWSVYRSIEGRELTGGSGTERVYSGEARVDALIPFDTYTIAAVSGASNDDPCGIYRSSSVSELVSSGQNHVTRLYNGRFRVHQMMKFRGGLMTAFVDERNGESQGVYYSRTGNHPATVSWDTTMAASPLRTGGQIEVLVETTPGLVAAYCNPTSRKSWGIYLSADGNAVAGSGTNSRRAYVGQWRPDAVVAFGTGVLIALYDPYNGQGEGTYYSPDGLNLGGGGSTVQIHPGPLRVGAMIPAANGLVVAFFDPKSGGGLGIRYMSDIRLDSLSAVGTRSKTTHPFLEHNGGSAGVVEWQTQQT